MSILSAAPEQNGIQPPEPPRRTAARGLLPALLYVLASILIGRATLNQNLEFNQFAQYESGRVEMPYQARYMMVPVLRWAAHSPLAARLAWHLGYSTRSPEDAVLEAVECACLLLLGGLVVRLRRRFAPPPLFEWLAPAIFLCMMAATFVVLYEHQIAMPYDYPAVLFFTAGLVACVERRAWLLLLLIPLATYNRETTVFLLPVWLACAWETGRAQAALVCGAGLAEWLLVRWQVMRWIHATSWGLLLPWRRNLYLLTHPQHWAQMMCVFGFLALPMWLYRGLIEDALPKRIWMACSFFIVALLVVGIWNETRIFGELVPLAACTAAVEFEAALRRRALAAEAL